MLSMWDMSRFVMVVLLYLHSDKMLSFAPIKYYSRIYLVIQAVILYLGVFAGKLWQISGY